jgi:hypothetical protein
LTFGSFSPDKSTVETQKPVEDPLEVKASKSDMSVDDNMSKSHA